MTPPARRLEHQRAAEQRNTSSAMAHSPKAAYRRHPAQIKPLYAKEDSPVFVNKLGERFEPNQFRKKQWTEP
jgi:hypothetical protein